MSSYLSLWVPTYRGSLDVRIPFDGVQLKRRETRFVRRVQLARRTRTQAQVGLRQLSRLTLHPWTSSPQECNSVRKLIPMNRTQQIAVLLISEYSLTVSGRSTSEALTLCQPFINSAYLASDSHSQGTAIWHAHVSSQRVICLFKLASLCIRAGFCGAHLSSPASSPLAQAYFTTT